MRIACVLAPQIALQAVLRRDPERWRARDLPIALATGAGERARIIALTAAAARARVRREMTVSQARAVAAGLPDNRKLQILVASATDTAAAEAALADLGFGFAARVQSEPGRSFFEIGDLGALFPGGEAAIAQQIELRAARLGLVVRVGIASSKGLARIATATLSSVSAGPEAPTCAIVPDDGAAEFLAPLPVRVALTTVENAAALTERLERWGVTTLGGLRALPIAEVALRLGEEGARAWRLAAGRDDEPFAPTLPPDAIEEGCALDDPIEALEPLAFVLRGLTDRALARLAYRHLACASLTLRLQLDPRGCDLREVTLAAPCREAGTIVQLLRLDLARRPPGAAITGAALLVQPARVRAEQLDFLRPPGPAPARMAATLARLSALVGPENVGVPAEVDDHREEAIALHGWKPAPPAPSPLDDGGEGARNRPGALSIRRYRPPRALDVLMGRTGPVALRGDVTTARVLVAAGPYRSNGQWWQEEGFSRDYWDMHASDGAVYRVHQDRHDGRWYLDGYYD